VQEWLAARLLGSAAGELRDPGRPLDRCLHVPPDADIAARLAVHAGGYPARLHEALAETYPAVARWVGPDGFAALVRRYADTVALTSYNLNEAGAALPQFLVDDPLARAQPFVPDLAALEWRVAVAFHAEECASLDPRALGWGVDDWTSAVLSFQPAVAVVASPFPLLELWSAREGSPVSPAPDASEDCEHVIVRRTGWVVRCETISAAEARALTRMLAGQPLAAVAAALAEDGCDPAVVSRWFGRWIADAMVIGATRPEQGERENGRAAV
jgi:hypothetical protein